MNKLMLNFADWLLKHPLLELAQQRNLAIDKIESQSEPINEHLFKLYVMQKSLNRDHWINEIDTFLNIVDNATWSKKREKLEEKDYFNWLFIVYFYDNEGKLKINLKRRLENLLNNKYKEEIKIKWTLEEFKNMSESFFKYFCPKIEKNLYTYEDLEKYIEERFTIE